MNGIIRPSRRHPRYLENGDGSTFIPVGCNICFCRDNTLDDTRILQTFTRWMTDFASQGGNFMRLWLGTPFCNVVPERAGVYSQTALDHIRALVALAERLGIRLKLTLEHFRFIGPDQAPAFPGIISFANQAYDKANGGPAADIAEFFTSEAGQRAFLDKCRFLADAGIGDSPAVAIIELWNEINSLLPTRIWKPWTEQMLPSVQRLFPRQLITQSLGSFSGTTAWQLYDALADIDANPILQAHRYLDPGAELDVCRSAPIDVLAAAAVRELLDRRPDRPALLAEVGAVEANHARYSDLYAHDTQGILLHDMLFAPFFAGAAGCGQPWHWDHIYLDRHRLHWHFRRFLNAIDGFDPIAENARPFHTETHTLRCHGLLGSSQALIWCRDKASTWQAELVDGQPAATLTGQRLPLPAPADCDCYLPWEDRRQTPADGNGASTITLPDFTRSIVVRCRF